MFRSEKKKQGSNIGYLVLKKFKKIIFYFLKIDTLKILFFSFFIGRRHYKNLYKNRNEKFKLNTLYNMFCSQKKK